MKSTNLIIGLVVLALAFMGVSYLISGLYSIIKFLGPVLLIIALILDKDTIINFAKWMFGLFKKDWMMGLGVTLGTVLLFPFVMIFLVVKAYVMKKVKTAKADYDKRVNGELVDYEEVESEPMTRIELPPIREKQSRGGNSYDDVFE